MSAEVLVILLLIVANGIFAMSEIAVVTARRVRLQQRADAGDKGARAALRIASHPTEFLSTVQVGITLVGIFAGAFGGATLTGDLQAWLQRFPLVAPYSEAVALSIVVGVITYLSLVIGELVPKAIALHNPERIASLVAGPVAAVARVGTPLVKVLSWSTNLFLWAFRIRPSEDRGVTEEEIRALIKQAAVSGDVAPQEQKIVEQVFRLGDRRVSAIMTPRHDIEWLDVNEGVEGVRRHLADVKHPKILCCDGNLDTVLGVARTEQLLALVLSSQPFDVRTVLQPPLYVPATLSVFKLIDRFRNSPVHFALVLDEFGAIEGLVTPTDILESLVGEIPSEPHAEAGPITERGEGSWLIDGAIPFEDLAAAIAVPALPEQEQGAFQTLAGFVMTRLSRVPREGDRFTWGDLRFEVVDMDGRRVDKVLVERTSPPRAAGD
jgi:putative hemolysin